MITRVCTQCSIEKPLADFRKSKKGKYGTRANCTVCERKRSRDYYAKNPPSKEEHRERNLKNTRGISIERYNNMFLNQKGRCAICTKHQNELKSILNVDHCHETGRIRGLLCHNCNVALGFLKEDPTIISNMIDYLR